MTQFQESASVRTLGTPRAADTAPFLAITAGLVAVLMAVAVISFVATGRPFDATIDGTADSAAVDGYLAGLTAANKQHQLEGAALAMRRPITSTDGQQRLAGAQQLNDGWAAGLAMQRPITATDGWEATLLQPKEDAVDTYSQRFITAD